MHTPAVSSSTSQPRSLPNTHTTAPPTPVDTVHITQETGTVTSPTQLPAPAPRPTTQAAGIPALTFDASTLSLLQTQATDEVHAIFAAQRIDAQCFKPIVDLMVQILVGARSDKKMSMEFQDLTGLIVDMTSPLRLIAVHEHLDDALPEIAQGFATWLPAAEAFQEAKSLIESLRLIEPNNLHKNELMQSYVTYLSIVGRPDAYPTPIEVRKIVESALATVRTAQHNFFDSVEEALEKPLSQAIRAAAARTPPRNKPRPQFMCGRAPSPSAEEIAWRQFFSQSIKPVAVRFGETQGQTIYEKVIAQNLTGTAVEQRLALERAVTAAVVDYLQTREAQAAQAVQALLQSYRGSPLPADAPTRVVSAIVYEANERCRTKLAKSHFASLKILNLVLDVFHN